MFYLVEPVCNGGPQLHANESATRLIACRLNARITPMRVSWSGRGEDEHRREGEIKTRRATRQVLSRDVPLLTIRRRDRQRRTSN
jgi:hypothetical protein